MLLPSLSCGDFHMLKHFFRDELACILLLKSKYDISEAFINSKGTQEKNELRLTNHKCVPGLSGKEN